MLNQELINFIQIQLQQGVDKSTIINALLTKGWQQQVIDEAFKAATNPQTKNKVSKKRIVLITFSVLIFLIVLLIFLLPTILNFIAKDIEPIDDSDLQLQTVSIPDEQNAYFELIKLENTVYYDERISDLIEEENWYDQLVEEILSKNTQAFEYWDQAAQKMYFQDPRFAKSPMEFDPNLELKYLITTQKMVKIKSLQALYLFKQGKSDEAIAEILKVLKISHLIQNSQGTLTHYLVGTSFKRIALDTIMKILEENTIPSKELIALIPHIDSYRENRVGLIAGFKEEYNVYSNVIHSFLTGDTLAFEHFGIQFDEDELANLKHKLINNREGFYYQPNKTKAMLADSYRFKIANVMNECNKIKDEDRIVLDIYSSIGFIKFLFTENSYGILLYNLTQSSYTSILHTRCQEEFLVSATQLLLALKAYKQDHGELPTTLDELVPNYIIQIPKDPYDGEKIKYSKEKQILYSIGKDLTDNGGTLEETQGILDIPDPTIKITF